MAFVCVSPTELVLELPANQQQIWQQSQQMAPAHLWWQTYLNQVCLQTLLPWLQAEYAPEVAPWPNAAALPELWLLVPGTALQLGSKRLLVLPDKTLDTDELRVPQEWVDIPTWAADYYLAAVVDPDDREIWFWGYTTHAQLKTAGQYNPDDRTYVLESQQLIRDLSVLWVVHQLNPEEPTQAALAPLPEVSPVQADNLIQRLGNPALQQPRLEIPFPQWGALLADDRRRQQLLQLRSGEGSIAETVVQLGQWLRDQVTAGWQTLESILGPEADLAFSLRQSPGVSETTRRAKLLRLEEAQLLLLLELEPEADGRLSIRAQLRPLERTDCLPAGAALNLVSTTGEVAQSVQAREQDNLIQLRRFRCAPGTQFGLQVVLEGVSLTEAFIV